MPLIRVDYNPQALDVQATQKLVQLLLDQSIETFNSNLDAVSVFTKPYDALDHSTAAAEVEVRAKVAEFDRPDQSRDEVREQYIATYLPKLKSYLKELRIDAPIIFTITFEDWKVEVVSAD